MKPDIIPLTESHLNDISTIYAEAFSSPLNRPGKRIKTRNPDYWRLYLTKSTPYSLGIRLHHRLIGFSFIHYWGDYLWIGPIGILPEYQSQGFGRRLLQSQIEQTTADRELYMMALESSSPVSTLAFYLHSGFIQHALSFKFLLNHTQSPPPAILLQHESLTPQRLTHLPFMDHLYLTHHLDLKTDIYHFLDAGLGQAWLVHTPDHRFQALVFWIHDLSPYDDSSYLTYKCILAEPNDPTLIQSLFCYLAHRHLQNGCRYSLLTLQSPFQSLIPHFPWPGCKLIQYTFLMNHHLSRLDLPRHLFYAFSWNG